MIPHLRVHVLALLLVTTACAFAMDSPTFRGPDRNGIFAEKGLLDSWPAEGPPMNWSWQGLGEGYASVAVAEGRLFTTGKTDLKGFLFAFDLKGKLLWKINYGPETDGSGFPGARCTPTVDGDLVYITSGPGMVYAHRAQDGKRVWAVDMAEFGGRRPNFGFSDSLLIDGDRLICTPGGDDSTLVALNKKDGSVIWTSKGLSDNASYCSARIYQHGDLRQIVTMTANAMVGVDPEKGTPLWRQAYPGKYDIHAISPVYQDRIIFVSDGYKQGSTAFELAADGRSVKELWKEEKLDIHHGGTVLVDGHVYGAASGGTWMCLDLKTGEIKARHRDLGKGSAVFADNMIYGYDERGRVGIMRPDPDNFSVISSFEIEKGSGQHWAHPVIAGGQLYIRHGDALMSFNLNP